MNESKITLHDRWRREGRWPEVSKFIETVRAECKERGLKKAEATVAAWDAAEEGFPPLAPETAPEASDGTLEDAELLMDPDAPTVALDAAAGRPRLTTTDAAYRAAVRLMGLPRRKYWPITSSGSRPLPRK